VIGQAVSGYQSVTFFNLKAFSTTVIELKLMAIAENTGLNFQLNIE
jgi:hypothetical protein